MVAIKTEEKKKEVMGIYFSLIGKQKFGRFKSIWLGSRQEAGAIEPHEVSWQISLIHRIFTWWQTKTGLALGRRIACEHFMV